MGIDPKSLGYEIPPIEFVYSWRDTVLYALGVGASPEWELDFLYEGHGPKVLPTYCTVPVFTAFDALVERIGCDRSGMVHHSQAIRLARPLAAQGTLRVSGRVEGLYDLKRLAKSVFVMEARDETGEVVVEGEVVLLLLKDGGFGGERPPRAPRVKAPDREPDFEWRQTIPTSQALLYRLNGDYNPLHADPEFAEQVGFDRPILHGLCTYGYAGRALVEHACDGDPERLQSFEAQFSGPVFPGDTLIVRGWRESGEVLLNATTEARPDELCLSQARAVIR